MNWYRLANGTAAERRRAVVANWLRFGAYVCHTAGGVLLVIYPLRTALTAIAAGYTYAGAALFLLGGLLSALGTVFHRWSGEAVGLPMCFTAYAVYGCVLLLRGTLAGIAVGLLFMAAILWLLDRWTYVMYMLRLANESQSEH